MRNLLCKFYLDKEKDIIVNIYKENEDEIIIGDIIAFGSWYNLELDECIEYLKIVKEQNKMKRDFSKFI